MNYQLKDIAKIIAAERIGQSAISEITQVSFDTRKPIQGKSTLFVALSGTSADGHQYVKRAYELGCRSFLVSRMAPDFPKEANYLMVTDALRAIQELASHHRQNFQGTVVGITGSTGKTTIKEWLYELLHLEKRISKSPKSFNSQLGVALSALLISNKSDLAILEAGISKEGEMTNLQRIIKPDIGLFSNIGDAHQANFESYEKKVQEKMHLFSEAKLLLYCVDHDVIHREVKRSFKRKTKTWGASIHADLKVLSRVGKVLDLEYKGERWTLKLEASDAYHYENVMHCVLFSLTQGLSIDFLKQGIPQLSTMSMRLEMKHGVDNILLVNDSYSADFQSLEVALDYLNSIAANQSKTLVLSDFVEQYFSEEEYLTRLNALIQSHDLAKVIGIGPLIGRFGNRIEVEELQLFEGTEEFLSKITSSMFKDEAVLVKGARKFRLERVVNFFQAKSNRTRLEVNLGALKHNYQWFRNRLPVGTEMMVMVKALSYGAGSFEVARLIEGLGARYLAVAYADEGVFLRRKGVTCPIMVLNPEAEGFVNLIQYNLEPELYSLSMTRDLVAFLKNEMMDHPMKVHLNFDTGMHRLGFVKKEMDQLIKALTESEDLVHVASVFTHLAASDDPQHRNFTQGQLDDIDRLTSAMKERLGYDFLVHACNTSGVLNYGNSCFDMVRLGIGFYGIDPSGNHNPLMPALKLVTQISQVKEIEPGQSVGYGRGWIAQKKSTTATVPIGYADGLPRTAGNLKAQAYVNGKPVPFVGSICMDMSMLDVSGLRVQEGDEVVIFETQAQLEQFSKDIDTIPYEVLAGISQRVKRVFIED